MKSCATASTPWIRTLRGVLRTPAFMVLIAAGCSASSLDSRPAGMGTAVTWQEMTSALDQPGPIELEKVVAARWAVNLSGLLNLDHPEAQAAGLEDRLEAIEIYTYVIRHPSRGTFLVDSGVSEAWRDPAGYQDVAWLIRRFMNTDALEVQRTTRELIVSEGPIAGVFLTHIHLDHIMGIADQPPGTPVYVGPGETGLRSGSHAVTRGTTDRLLANAGTLQEWQFDAEAVVDVFGDASLFAIHVPGHTPGSTAYLVRTLDGPMLLTGDACHTEWGWRHGVEPGTFSADRAESAVSLDKLESLARQYPGLAVHPGHQSLTGDAAQVSAADGVPLPAGER